MCKNSKLFKFSTNFSNKSKNFANNEEDKTTMAVHTIDNNTPIEEFIKEVNPSLYIWNPVTNYVYLTLDNLKRFENFFENIYCIPNMADIMLNMEEINVTKISDLL